MLLQHTCSALTYLATVVPTLVVMVTGHDCKVPRDILAIHVPSTHIIQQCILESQIEALRFPNLSRHIKPDPKGAHGLYSGLDVFLSLLLLCHVICK